MQVYNKSNSIGIKTLLLFAAVLFIAYLPVSSFQFFIKNDAFNGYFPPRFFMSESLKAGYLPLWNPYINFGFPQYGDMSGGFWSPFTWLIAITTGYNAYVFTLEILFYILIGGAGMYKLASIWSSNKTVCSIAGISFMCSGFNIGHLQHVNWLSGLAFLTWSIYFFLRLQHNISLKNILISVLAFYLFISSAHPTLIISSIYFFIFLLVFTWFPNESTNGWKQKAIAYLKANLALIAILLLVSTGMIISYLDIIPHFVRGQKLDLATSISNSSAFSSWVSMLLPFSTVKNTLLADTDLSMRNHYMGVVVFIFLLQGIVRSKTRWQWFLLICGLFFLFLSTGGIVKTIIYYLLPMMSYVRLNGIYSGTAIICFILFAAIEMNKFTAVNDAFQGTIKKICYCLSALLIGVIAYGIINVLLSGDSLFYNLGPNANTSFAKGLVDNISFYDTILIQGSIQLSFLVGIILSLRKKNFKTLYYICIADMVIASLLNIPFTGAGKASVAQVQQVLNKTPKGIPIPLLHPINQNDSLTIAENGLTGHWSMYGKQPGVTHEVPYPITLNIAREYFDTIKVTPTLSLMNKPLVHIVPESILATKPEITSFKPGEISIKYSSLINSTLVLQQNYYQYWYYDDGNKIKPVEKSGINFIAVPIHKGENKIRIFFNPSKIKAGMLISLTSFIGLLIAIFFLYRRRAK